MPAEWHSWPGRLGRRQGKLGELGAQFTARGAVHPMQAMLNYAVGILAARMARVVIARGLDASFGFLHDGRKPGRLSLVWDCVEPLRPKLVKAVFGYVATHEFERRDYAALIKRGLPVEGGGKINVEAAEEWMRLNTVPQARYGDRGAARVAGGPRPVEVPPEKAAGHARRPSRPSARRGRPPAPTPPGSFNLLSEKARECHYRASKAELDFKERDGPIARRGCHGI